MNTLCKFQAWYAMHCDGDWEHQYGVEINTLDNPGWKVKIDLNETLLADVDFADYYESHSEENGESWCLCKKEGTAFVGMCSPTQLEHLLDVFLDWTNANTRTVEWDNIINEIIEKCDRKHEGEWTIDILRSLYYQLEDIPNEHPLKAQALTAFNQSWNSC